MANSKSKATLSLDPHIWDQFKNETESASGKVEDLIKTWLNTQGNDTAELKDRRRELEEEKDDLEEQMQRIQNRIDNIEGEIDSIDAALEKKEEENQRVEQAVQDLANGITAARESAVDKELAKLKGSQQYHNYLEQLDVDAEEFKQRIREEVRING